MNKCPLFCPKALLPQFKYIAMIVTLSLTLQKGLKIFHLQISFISSQSLSN